MHAPITPDLLMGLGALLALIATTFRFHAPPRWASPTRWFRLCGVTFSWSSYGEPKRPTTGAPIGVLSSFWIHTKRHAYGRGRIVNWAMPQNIELLVLATDSAKQNAVTFNAALTTVDGIYTLHEQPTATEVVTVIHNKGQVSAEGYLMILSADDPPAALTATARIDPIKPNRAEHRARVTITPRPSDGSSRQIGQLALSLVPESSLTARSAKLYGRPEWIE